MDTTLVLKVRDGWEDIKKLPTPQAEKLSRLFTNILKRKTSGYNFLPCDTVLSLLELPSAMVTDPAPAKQLCQQWQDRLVTVIPIISTLTYWSDIVRLYGFLAKHYTSGDIRAQEDIKKVMNILDEIQSDSREKVILKWNAKTGRLHLFRDPVGIKVSHEYKVGKIILTIEDCLGSPTFNQEASVEEPASVFGGKDSLVTITNHVPPKSCSQIILPVDTLNILHGITRWTRPAESDSDTHGDESHPAMKPPIISRSDVNKASMACYKIRQANSQSDFDDNDNNESVQVIA